MKKALFAGLASVAMLGASCSCSVKDFAPVVLDSASYAYSYNDAGNVASASAILAAAPTGSTSLSVGSVFSSLWVGEPQAQNYSSTDNPLVLRCTGVLSGTELDFLTAYSSSPLWNRIYLSPKPNAYESIANFGTLYLDSSFGYPLFGGLSNLSSNRNVTLYFTEPFKVTYVVPGNAYFADDFRVPQNDNYGLGYDAGESSYEIVRNLSSFEFNYYTGSGDDEERHTIVKADSEAVSYISSYVTNGLVSFRGVVDDLTDGVTEAHDITALLHYSIGKTIDAAPLYIDYEALASPVAQEFQTHLRVYQQAVQVPWYVFNADLDVGYQGNLSGYPSASLSDRYKGYSYIAINYPMLDVGGRLNYIGILSGYAQGYADGVASRDGEVDDLTEQILGLEEDLAQYEGKTYQQIYNSGYQAGLDEENQGARTFNSLFGNILTAPLTILNGVSDISFFGMPILTAILSLLMVALALFLFKRFK